MAYRLATPEGKKFYRLRKQMPEPVFGIIKVGAGCECRSNNPHLCRLKIPQVR
jgi:hypothetical protein